MSKIEGETTHTHTHTRMQVDHLRVPVSCLSILRSFHPRVSLRFEERERERDSSLVDKWVLGEGRGVNNNADRLT